MGKAGKATVATLERSPSHLLHRALQLALDVYTDEAGDIGLTQRQYAVLAAVSANEGLTQTDLVRATGIDRSTLADMIARMIAKGYLARERSATDGRANTVSLTVEGRTMLDAAEPKVAEADRRILAQLAANKRDSFIAVLRDLAKAGEKTLLGETDAEAKRTKKKAAKAEKAEKAPKAEKTPRAEKPEKKKKKKAKDHPKKA